MNIQQAIVLLSSLSQETRLQIYRLLIRYGEKGIAAGKLSDQLGVAHNTLSFHLSQLSHAGLISSRRESRSIIYFANLKMMNGLVAFLVENCCREDGSEKADCKPAKTSSCAPARGKKKSVKTGCC